MKQISPFSSRICATVWIAWSICVVIQEELGVEFLVFSKQSTVVLKRFKRLAGQGVDDLSSARKPKQVQSNTAQEENVDPVIVG